MNMNIFIAGCSDSKLTGDITRQLEDMATRLFSLPRWSHSPQIRENQFSKMGEEISRSNLLVALLQPITPDISWSVGYAYGIGVSTFAVSSMHHHQNSPLALSSAVICKPDNIVEVVRRLRAFSGSPESYLKLLIQLRKECQGDL